MRTKYEWLKIFEEQEKSNLNEKEYCKIHSINLQSFKTTKIEFSKQFIEEESELDLKTEYDNIEKTKWSLVQSEHTKTSENLALETESTSLTVEVGKFKIQVNKNSNLDNFKRICEVLINIC